MSNRDYDVINDGSLTHAGRRSALPSLDDPPSETERTWLRNLLDHPSDRIFFKDRKSRFLMVSRGWLAHAGGGRSLTDVVGKTDFDIFSKEHAAEAFADEQGIMATGEPVIAKLERETFSDRPDSLVSTTKVALRDRVGQIIGTFGISRDVTEEVTREALAHHALHDQMTGLPNRAAFMAQLPRALASLARQPGQIALAIVDLDGFAQVNGTLGRDLGDQLLFEAGARLRKAARHSDLVARYGADHFAVLCEALLPEADLHTLSGRLLAAFERPMLGSREVAISATLGFAATCDPAIEPADLLARAEAATRDAKRRGHGHVEFQRADATSPAPASTLDELRLALARDELFLLYQPVLSVDTLEMVGVETLVRWRHPSRGVLAPCDFIPQAEQGGLIGELDDYVLRHACEQLAAWNRSDPRWSRRTVAVNLSAQGVHDPRLVAKVVEELARSGLEPGQLCLEITETALIGKLDDARRITAELSGLGVRIALDDFGTGFSTLVHLQQLRPHMLKIDRSFVARLGLEPRDREIVTAVNAMAQALGMTVVAEGVETPEQLDILRSIECQEAQGYLFARPLPPEECFAFCAEA
jgi:diguanylate cyclase (GGDEF)-like protein/PAS domain S-box-containing protein